MEQASEPLSGSFDIATVLLLLGLVGLMTGAVFLIRSVLRNRAALAEAQANAKRQGSPEDTGSASRQERPLNIFISYRRSDSSDACGRLYDRLVAEFGPDHVFRDVDSINPGYDFQHIIDQHIEIADVGLVLIGPDWAGLEAGDGIRLQRAEDFVRIEVASLLKQGIPVIPVLVRGASVPQPETLPEELKSLVRRNFSQLRPDPDFGIDIERLLNALRRIKAG